MEMRLQVIRKEPLVRVTVRYDYEVSEYPDEIQVPMDDGHVIRYIRAEPVPEPHFEAAMDALDKIIGYQYQPKKRRRRRL